MKTIDQQRALFAWDRVKDAADGLSQNRFKEYVSLTRKLPALIQNSGLGPALAFLAAKAGIKGIKTDHEPASAHQQAYRHLEEWLTRPLSGDCPWAGPYAGEKGTVLDAIMSGDGLMYLRAKGEALAFLNYLKMFGTALEKAPAAPGRVEG